MRKNGNRIIYDGTDGSILHQTHDSEGTQEHKPISELKHLDLPYGYIDYKKSYIESINISTGLPVVRDYEMTEEQKRIKELEEDVLLLQTENEVGGIL